MTEVEPLSATPVPSRITDALDSRGLYGPDVDRACGVEEPAVDQWETGELVPTPEQLAKLAELTGYPIRFFYLPELQINGPIYVCQRSGRGKGCIRIDQAAG